MRKFLLFGFITLGVSFHAQKQKQTLKKRFRQLLIMQKIRNQINLYKI